jgi:hypothetical protein
MVFFSLKFIVMGANFVLFFIRIFMYISLYLHMNVCLCGARGGAVG